MAFKLTKGEQTRYDALTLAARETASALQDAITAHNEAASELKTFIEERAEDWRGQYEDKSDAWKDTDRGQQVDSWITTWTDYAERLDEIELNDLPDFEDDLPLAEPEE